MTAPEVLASRSTSSAQRGSRTKVWWLTRPALAGISFSVAWIIGLVVVSASTQVTASGAQVIVAYKDQAFAGVLQYLFTEGLPPVALLIVVGALAHRMRTHGNPRIAAVAWGAALVGCIVSFVQFVLGVLLVAVAVPAQNVASSGALSDAVTRLDGVKMLLFGVMSVGAFIYLRSQRRQLWLLVVCVLLAVTIAVSGLGYLLTVPALADAAYASLLLLLVWVTGFGIALGRRAH